MYCNTTGLKYATFVKFNNSCKQISQILRHCHSQIKESNPHKNFRNDWKNVIGLEIHAQLSTNSKLFSSASTLYGAPTNTSVALFDAAMPGTLPVLNKEAVKLAVVSALALGCKINSLSSFDRKHYFYSDLPAGYQITQQRQPLGVNGKVDFAVYQPGVHKQPYYKTSKIKQVQLEQDSGKSLHAELEKKSFIDLNRAGIALIEIVFEPDIENEYEATALVKEVIDILERVGSGSCKLQEGALRVDVNISTHKAGSDLGVRTEIKNLGSIHAISSAIKYEAKRQLNLIKKGKEIKNQTLAWDPCLNETIVMRDKEEVQDYRYMPEPNLPPLRLIVDEYSENFHKNDGATHVVLDFRNMKEKLPSLPQDERKFLIQKYDLSDIFAYNLVNQNKLFQYFKEIMTENPLRDPRTTYLFLMYPLLAALKSKEIDLDSCPLSASHLGQLIDLLQNRRISKLTSEDLLLDLLNGKSQFSPNELVEKNNLWIMSNSKELRKICIKIVGNEEAALMKYRKKKKMTIFNDLISKVLQETKNRADTQVLPRVMTEVLNEHIEES